jgi:hypothetical protein
MDSKFHCPECDSPKVSAVTRRKFVQTVGATVAATSASSFALPAVAGVKKSPKPENVVKKLYASLSPQQKEKVCFAWDYENKYGVLRTHVSNNWHITPQTIASDFFTNDQEDMIEAIFFGLYEPDWRDKIMIQLKDDAGGYGEKQNIAIFGEPGSGKFEFVMTGRHLTIRCDGDSTEHPAFGGPIFYGHAAQGFHEKADHPGNVFWHQALKANKLYKMLDGKQRKQALVSKAPAEEKVHFQGKDGKFSGIPVAELSADQKEHLEGVLETLLEPYRKIDKKEAMRCLNEQGGLDTCSVTFYQTGAQNNESKNGDIGNDGVWDIWRLEGPSFVWHWRGAPHVHVWVNIADDPSFKINCHG